MDPNEQKQACLWTKARLDQAPRFFRFFYLSMFVSFPLVHKRKENWLSKLESLGHFLLPCKPGEKESRSFKKIFHTQKCTMKWTKYYFPVFFLVLPHYAPDDTDEFGSKEGHMKKLETGEVEVLQNFERTLITRSKPRKGCKRGHPTGERKKFLDRWDFFSLSYCGWQAYNLFHALVHKSS